ncbi:MAG: excinuclease ABC subunit UvrC [Dysgonamonadaceae bacterium]|jgi:excinuclease ABC subunit C|nr:excinuclease ABC subunit UvrC [Dysgonamonadaceae bacterium]
MLSSEELSIILSTIPEVPGCYFYLDENETIIYVGKAKNLKKRVNSYFNKTIENLKTKVMLQKIRNIRYMIVGSEEEALILENNLIKQHQPKYNILLKDDKTYPWIVVKNEQFPRIFLTRRKIDDKSRYYGPYTVVQNVKSMLHLLTTIYPVRNCSHVMTASKIENKKIRVCLQYHIKRCLAPCTGLQTESDYNENIRAIEEILKGNVNLISRRIYKSMMKCSAEMRYEEAARLKEHYMTLQNYSTRSVIVSNRINVDVFSFHGEGQAVYINYMHIVNGAIIQGFTLEYRLPLDEPREKILGMGIVELRLRFESALTEIIVPFLPNIELNSVKFTIPRSGERRKLLDLSEKNAIQYCLKRVKYIEQLSPDQRIIRVLKNLQDNLHLKEMPVHIECFDNSNIQGANPVSSCVVFRMAKPAKRDYRHFNIKTVTGPDDYASMRETIFRRYSRLIEEGQKIPQLIIIDGGKGQLTAAVTALKSLDLYGQIAIIGIAKRLEEIYFPEDPIPLYLDKSSESMKLIQRIRDEAHRFGITFHRDKRSKQQVISELDAIKGIGKILKTRLLQKYGSVQRIKDASPEGISELIGEKKAKILIEGLGRDKNFSPDP